MSHDADMLPNCDINAHARPFAISEWTSSLPNHELELQSPHLPADAPWSGYNVGLVMNIVTEYNLFQQGCVSDSTVPHSFLPPSICRSISDSHSEAEYSHRSSLKPPGLRSSSTSSSGCDLSLTRPGSAFSSSSTSSQFAAVYRSNEELQKENLVLHTRLETLE